MTRSLFIYLVKFKLIATIIATRAERANSRKLSRAADGCGTPIGTAVPSKALLVSFGRGGGGGGWKAEKV